VSYPNKADRKKSPHKNLGGDIFIHGSCVTIGCMPMTDDKIKEIYLYAIQARQNGQSKIPVYIFPFRMTEKNFGKYKNEYKNNPALVDFWKELKMGYEIFEANKIALDYSVDDKGNYLYHLLVNFGCY
jgi:murein L,D-transpeptidase YafK